MGMAASQARLLTLTARLADNELRSQTINNAKMRLATQSSQVSENYINALNNATMKFSNYNESGENQIQPLTFNALTAYSSYNTQYGLTNSSGQLLVSEAEALMFNKANGNVNSYLKLHGLEYTTTYFDELGSMKNENYPAPLDSVSAEELKLYYENYTSYQNSVELESYEKSYSEYTVATADFNKGAKDIYEAYLLNSLDNNPKLLKNEATNNFSIDTNLVGVSLVNLFKDMFTGSNNNSYNINALRENGFISQTDLEYLQTNYIDTVNYVQNHQLPNDPDTKVDGIKILQPLDLKFENDEYIIGDTIHVSVNESGNVINFVDDEIADQTSTKTYTLPAVDGSLSFKNFMSQLYYEDRDSNDENIKNIYQYNITGDGSDEKPYTLSEYTIISDETAQQHVINNKTNIIISTLKTYTNFENFANWLFAQSANNVDLTAIYGIDLNQVTSVKNLTLNELLNNYSTSKENFFNGIFSPEAIEVVQQHLINGQTFENANGETVSVTAKNFTDIDFCLQYMKKFGLQQTESFNTVIKSFLIDEMVEVNGEPKYAWVDSNDTGNTGNADAKAQWYTNLFERMQKGYKALENGLASSSEWLEFALENGIVTMEQVDKSFNWKGLDYKTCTRITEETDDAAVTKAEAEYNRAMNDIKAKDNIYDIQLKNIDTEHSAIQTEYDVIKGVIDKNISRTFKFNQSA